MITSRIISVLSAGLALTAGVQAQPDTSRKEETKFTADRAALSGAQTRRANLAAAIAGGGITAETAIAQLRGEDSPSGLKIDRDADFALAAIDVGHRLIALQQPAAAELFFLSAEDALSRVVAKTPDSATSEKAQYLSNLAFIRARFLNKAVQAKADLDAAQKLQPDDIALQGLRKALGSRQGETFKDQPSRK